MFSRGILTASMSLALLLASATACSSDDQHSDAHSPSHTLSSDAGPSSTTTAGAQHAVRLARAASASYCVLPQHGRRFGDFLWSGVRLDAAADATITGTEHSGRGVDVVGDWIVPSDKPSPGELVPWANGRRHFLPRVEWKARQEAGAARLVAGHQYTYVLRLRPRVGGDLGGVALHYRSGDEAGALKVDDRVSFRRHC